MSYKIYLFLGCLVSFTSYAQEKSDKEAFFNEESAPLSEPLSSNVFDWLKDKAYEGPVHFKRESFSGNVKVDKGPVEVFQSSITGELYLIQGDFKGQQANSQSIVLDQGSAFVKEMSVTNHIRLKQGNLKIESSHVSKAEVNGLIGATQSNLGTVIVTQEARFEDCHVRTIIVPSHATERLIRLVDSKVKDITFKGGEGIVYFRARTKIPLPRVKGGKLITQPTDTPSLDDATDE